MIKNISIIVAILLLFILLSSCTSQEEKIYKITGDRQENPNTYIFGIHPYKNPKAMLDAYYPMIQYLNKHMEDVEIQIEMSKDYSDFEKKLNEKRFHFALPNPYQALVAIKLGYTVIAKMSPDDDFKGIIVARKDKNIKSIRDLKGHKISFPSATALAAAMMPKMLMYEKGLNPHKDIVPIYVGSQESSILNAYYGDTFASSTWPVPWRIWTKKNPEMAKEMIIIYETKTLPNCPIVVRDDISNEVVKQFIAVLEKFNNDKDARIYLDNLEIDGFHQVNNKTYEPVRAFIDKYNRVLGNVR